MKKFFKYLGIAIAALLLIVIVSVWIFFCLYKDWFDFNDAIMKNDIEKMSSMIKKGYNINNRLYIYKDTDHLFFCRRKYRNFFTYFRVFTETRS